jgi:hypothetical protein
MDADVSERSTASIIKIIEGVLLDYYDGGTYWAILE